MISRRAQRRRHERMRDTAVAGAEASRRMRMCRGKSVYADELDAIHGAICASRSYGGAFRVYECPYCGGWHLTRKVDVEPIGAA